MRRRSDESLRLGREMTSMDLARIAAVERLLHDQPRGLKEYLVLRRADLGLDDLDREVFPTQQPGHAVPNGDGEVIGRSYTSPGASPEPTLMTGVPS